MEEDLKPIIVYGDLENVGKPRVKWRKRYGRNNRKVHRKQLQANSVAAIIKCIQHFPQYFRAEIGETLLRHL